MDGARRALRPGDRHPFFAPGGFTTGQRDARGAGGEPTAKHWWTTSDFLDTATRGRGARALKLASPALLALAGLLLALPAVPAARRLAWLGLSVAYLMPPAGLESVVPVGVGLGIHPVLMAYLVTVVDLACAAFISWNFELARRLPLLGRYIAVVEAKGARLLDASAAVRAGLWVALLLFIAVPFKGSGGITGAIVGRAVGLRPVPLLTALASGAFAGGLLIAYSAEVAKLVLGRDPVEGLIWLLLAALATLCVVLLVRLARMRRWERDGRF